MKREEATITLGNKTIIYSYETDEVKEHLTAEQKYILLLAAIGAAAFLGFIYILFG